MSSNFMGTEERLLAPHQPGPGALLDDPLEEAAEDPQAEAFPDAGEEWSGKGSKRS
jgi:hypothetical protein